MKTHTQCSLVRDAVHDICWLPTKFAVVGKVIRINDESGWLVTGVGDLPLPSAYIEERKNDYRTQRRASDV